MEMTDRKRQFLLFALLLLVLVLVVLMMILPKLLSKGKGEPADEIRQEVPAAENYDGPRSKRDSYNQSNINDYFDSLSQELESEDNERTTEDRSRGGTGRYDAPEELDADELFAPKEETRKEAAGPRPAAKPSKASSSSTKPASIQETVPEAIPDTANPESETEPAPKTKTPVKRSGAVSSLDEDVSADLGNGFSTLDGRDAYVQNESDKAYQCMFTRSEKIRSGQRITLRLLEDLVIGGVHIPCNTHLQGVCTISERMEVTISSLDMGGRIITLNFEAYDTDGGKGIYCSDLNSDAQKITNEGLNMATSGITSRVGRTARDVASLGASIVRNKAGEITVSIPSGYKFYIMEKEN